MLSLMCCNKFSSVVFDPGCVAEVFSDYFEVVNNCVGLDGVCSNFKTVKSGVPQG